MKTLPLAVLTLAFPATIAAQQPAADTANPVTSAFRGRIMAMHRNLAQAFDSIPADKFSYKPTPAQQTIGFIAQHLANDNYIFCNAFGDMKANRPAREAETPDSVKATWPKDTLIAQLKTSFEFCQRALGQLTDESLAQQAEMTFRGQTRSVGRANMVLGHAMDLTDHYSQIANYMRLNGILPPTALPRRAR
jgi:uncharacterized damage-inducible protein DinB